MDILLVIHHVEFFYVLLWLFLCWLRRFQRDSAFLANLLELLFHAGNKLTGCFADGIQTILERFQVFIL